MRSVVLAAALLALPAMPGQFRYSRPVAADPGWARLELPDEVLDACRPGLPDLRLVDAAGREIPYAFEGALEATPKRFAIENREAIAKKETDAEVDRGPSPGLADAVTLEIAEGEFLKPVRVESSSDRVEWKEIAHGSVFATRAARMTTLPLPATDRRHLRFRFDDRNSDPVRLEAVLLRPTAAEPPRVETPLPLQPVVDAADGVAQFTAVLPAANLDVLALRFEARDTAFSRPVRIHERVFFRDEVCRRLIAAGTLARTPGGAQLLEITVSPIAGRQLEIQVEDGDSPPLGDLRAVLVARPRFLRFDAPAGADLRLLYGSADAAAPRYDLARSLAGSSEGQAPLARLGPATETGAPAHPAVNAARVPLPEPEKWTDRRPIRLPSEGGVAYLDLYDPPRGLADLRIVDESGRQVPYIVESGRHGHRDTTAWSSASEGTVTTLAIPQPDHADAVEEIELLADAPEYFSRPVRVEQERRDARGPIAPRLLGEANWERRPGAPASVFRIPLARPGVSGAWRVEIDNGDNAPVRVTGIWLRRGVVRVDFVHGPGERLFLYTGNADARPPAYDLDLIAGTILAAPARPAAVGPAVETPRARPALGIWIWGAVGITILALLFELSRALPRRA